MVKVTTSKAREDLADLVSKVHYHGERVVLTRYRKPFAALVSSEDLKLLELIEDRVDVEAAKKALAESDERIPFDEVCQRLGL